MTRKTLKTAIMIIAVAFALPAFALPTMRITTPNGGDPPAGTLVTGGSPPSAYNSSPAFNFQYVSMSRFEILNSGNPLFNQSRNTALDSVRMRGNSTANVDMPKKPYRIKFGERVSLFGKPAARSWVLLANHMDKTFAMNALAFRLGKILGLEFTPTFQFVNLEICSPSGACTPKGIYQLTEQVQVNPGRVDIDEDKGWLVEFNFHNADANDIMFTSGSSRYNLSVFIKSPEIDDADYRGSSVSSYPQLAFVRNEFNAIMDTLANSARFQAGAHRDVIDLSSYAKYVFVQQFMTNFEWTEFGYVGSNFAYKNVGARMKAGPLWDFDLATGTLPFGSPTTYAFLSNSRATHSILPSSSGQQNAFYRRLLEDAVFRARYRKVWEENKEQIRALAADGGFIDSIATLLRNHITANWEPYKDHTAPPPGNALCFVGCGVVGSGPSSVSAYNDEIAKLKSWWNARWNHWNTQIAGTVSFGSRQYTFVAANDIPDNPLPVHHAIKVGRTPNLGGTVSLKIGSAAAIENPSGNNYAAEGTSVTITSSTNSNYRFTGWTAASGALPQGIDASRETITFTASGAVDIKANYQTGTSINDAARAKLINGNRVAVVRDGLRVNVVDNAVIRIYGLDGRELRKISLTRGDHKLRMNDLPGGLYMARVSMDGIVKTLRVPVR